MKKIVSMVLTFICILGVSFVTGCGNESSIYSFTKYDLDPVSTEGVNFVNKGKLTVAMSTDYAPMEFVDLTLSGQDKYIGADVELAKAIACAFGVELEIKAMDFEVTMTALDEGLADIAISGISYTDERAASYLFTDCYYSKGDGGQVVVIKKGNENKFPTLDSLNKNNIKIAAQSASLQMDLVKEQLPNATVVEITDLNSAYDALTSGSCDGVAVAAQVAETLVLAFPDKYVICDEAFDYIESGNYALVKKGNEALKDAVNKVIKQITNQMFSVWVDEANAAFAKLGVNAAEDIIPEEE